MGLALLANCASEMLSRMTVDSAAIEQHKQRNIILPQIWHSLFRKPAFAVSQRSRFFNVLFGFFFTAVPKKTKKNAPHALGTGGTPQFSYF